MANIRNTGRAWPISSGLAAGAGVSIGVTVMISIVLALLVDAELISWESIGYGIMITVFLSSFLGSVTACTTIKRQRVVVSFLEGMIYIAVLLAITALFFGGQYQAVGETIILVIGGSGCASMIGAGKNTSIRKRKMKLGYR